LGKKKKHSLSAKKEKGTRGEDDKLATNRFQKEANEGNRGEHLVPFRRDFGFEKGKKLMTLQQTGTDGKSGPLYWDSKEIPYLNKNQGKKSDVKHPSALITTIRTVRGGET